MANKNNETIENVTGNRFEPQQYVTFEPHVPANRVRMFNARNIATSLKNLGDTPIDIVDVMTEIGVRNRSGNPCQNTYIFTADGQVYFTQSNGLGKTINELVDMVEGDFKTNTTNGYVKVQIKETSLSGGRSYKQFQLLEA